MGQVIPSQHPAVVLRSHYTQLRALLAVAMIRGISAQPPSTRFDGGPEEGTRGAQFSVAPSNATSETRHDGGPEEGSRGPGR